MPHCRLLIADFTSNFATSATAALYIFFASYVFELPNHASTALLLYFFAGFLAMPVWMKLSYTVGKTRAIQIALAYGILVQSGLFLVADPGNILMFWGYTFLYGVAYGAVPPILRSMMADVTDIDELQSGKAGRYVLCAAHDGEQTWQRRRSWRCAYRRRLGVWLCSRCKQHSSSDKRFTADLLFCACARVDSVLSTDAELSDNQGKAC